MAWFNKKKDEGLPELPALQSEKNSFPSLKDLPDVPQKQEFKSLPQIKPLYSQNSAPIKQVLNSTPNISMMHAGSGSHTRQIEDVHEAIPSIRTEPDNFSSEKKPKEPIYIRLDKFESTFTSFKEIKEKIKEVEEYLHKLKEIKEKEENELEEWEREIQLIKARIDTIDKTIFDKVE